MTTWKLKEGTDKTSEFRVHFLQFSANRFRAADIGGLPGTPPDRNELGVTNPPASLLHPSVW
jgi:hypothetical protein